VDRLLTTKELADLLRINEKKVYQLVREAGIPHVRIAGKWLFPRDHLLRWIDERVEREKDVFIVGSDDILLGRLLASYSQGNFPQSLGFYSAVGSLKGLDALSRRKAHACCVHLLDVESGEYNLPFIKRYASGHEWVVVNLWYRRQGLIVRRGNPLGIKGMGDIARKGARFINRNEGSGTRVLIEYLLREEGVEAQEIKGFGSEVSTHMEVALKVLLGEADVGMGIEYVTHLLPLDFVPLREERFDLVVPKELWHTKAIGNFLSLVTPLKIKELFPRLPGYSFRETGKVILE